MQEINMYKIKPGTYEFCGRTIVVMDIITHTTTVEFDTEYKEHQVIETFLPDPLVVYRDLQGSHGYHKTMTIALSVFERRKEFTVKTINN